MSKCKHETAEVITTGNGVTLEECTWGCGETVVSFIEGGVTHGWTVSELVSLREQLAEAVEIMYWLAYIDKDEEYSVCTFGGNIPAQAVIMPHNIINGAVAWLAKLEDGSDDDLGHVRTAQ